MTTGNFVYPFLSLFLTQKEGMTEYYAGITLMFTAFACVAGSIVGGVIADFFSRKYVIFGSLVLSGLCYIIIPYIHDVTSIIILITLSLALLSASEPALNSIIADLTGVELRKEAYSLIYWGASIGFAVGPLIAGFLFNHNINLIFWGDGAATLVAAILVLLFVLNPTIVNEDDEAEEENGLPDIKERFIKSVLKNPLILLFCFFFIAHSFIYSQTNFALPLMLTNLFKGIGAEVYGLLMTVNGIAIIILTPLMVKYTKKISAASCVALGIALYAIGFGIYIFTGNIVWLIISVVIWSAGEILSVTNSKVYLAENTRPSQRGRYNIFLDISFEVGFGAGPGIMGKVINSIGMMFVWIIIVFVSVISSVSIFLIGVSSKRKKALTT